jgi:hypothetical protein
MPLPQHYTPKWLEVHSVCANPSMIDEGAPVIKIKINKK